MKHNYAFFASFSPWLSVSLALYRYITYYMSIDFNELPDNLNLRDRLIN